jgi:LysM repeat protein
VLHELANILRRPSRLAPRSLSRQARRATAALATRDAAALLAALVLATLPLARPVAAIQRFPAAAATSPAALPREPAAASASAAGDPAAPVLEPTIDIEAMASDAAPTAVEASATVDATEAADLDVDGAVPLEASDEPSEPIAPEPVAAPDPVVDPRPLIQQVQTYRVAPGDTLVGVARRFGIDVATLRATNPLPDPDRLLVGQALVVLPVPGILATAAPGETIGSLAQRYGVPAAIIASANGLAEAPALQPGQQVLVPGGKPLVITSVRGAMWPAAGTGVQHKAQFIAAAVPAARASQQQTGVPASVTLGQAILESNWGDSVLARDANNLFGIKAYGAAASSPTYWMPAWEVVDGEDVESFEPFRAYPSPEASFADHGLFFRQNSRYWPALALASDPRAFAQAIAAAGYATDPVYGAKLIAIMDAYQLYQYDLA